MRSPIVTIAQKEIIDAFRDTRSLISAALYSAMGPVVVAMVAVALRGTAKPAAAHEVLGLMAAVFTIVAPFTGGMNVAMDTIAGERERGSLLPLLLTPATGRQVIVGKWFAVLFYAVAGLVLNIAGTALIVGVPMAGVKYGLPLAMLGAALELLISTACKSTKEAHTYLSFLVFLPMGVGMFAAFTRPQVPAALLIAGITAAGLLAVWAAGQRLSREDAIV